MQSQPPPPSPSPADAIADVERIEAPAAIVNDDEYKCDDCGKILKTSGGLRLHKKSHTDNHICPVCLKRCVSPSHLKTHSYQHTPALRTKLECHICNKTFTQKYSLKVHISSVHNGVRPFECRTCHKWFCRQYVLKRHCQKFH